MISREIVETLLKLSIAERLMVIDTLLHSVRNEFQKPEQMSTEERKRQLIQAAESLLSDYQSDKELTAFTSLDGEDFH